MTREERKKAIEVLDDMKVKIDIPKAAKTQNDRNWALDMAIKLLEQEPCDDVISREDVLDAIFDYWYKKNIVGCSGEDIYKDCAFIIKQLPSVQPSRKGHWIKEVDFGNVPYYVCSECGVESVADTDFCFACGTDMRGDT